MSDEPMTLIERLRNPAWKSDLDRSEPFLDAEQTLATMTEAADTLGALMAIIKMANVDRT
jgi:hypothetical protein